MQWVLLLLAILAGALNPFQNVNAELQKNWQQPVWTTAWVYLTGLCGVMLLQAFLRHPLPAHDAVQHAPWWSYLGGLISIGSTMIALVIAQRLGSGVFTGLSITASILVSILLDQMGWIGFTRHAASPLRLLGAALMVTGVWLVSRF